VIPLVGGTVTEAARKAGHTTSFVLTLVMLLALLAYVVRCSKRRRGTTWKKYGPTILTIISIPLIMADPSRHVLQDQGAWPPPSSNEYRAGCPTATIRCLSVLGVFFTIIFTYLGFCVLMYGSLWNGNIMGKLREIRQHWRELRNGEHDERK